MDKIRRKNDVLSDLNNMMMPSDYFSNQVVSPYRIKAETEPKPSIVRANRMEQVRRINEAGKKQKEEADRKEFQRQQRIERAEAEAEKQRLREEAEQKERDRIRANEDAYKKQQQQLQKQYETQKKQIQETSAKEEKLKDERYEKDYQWWQKDVEKHPDKYSTFTKAVVGAANSSAIFDPLARAIFGIKNRTGNVAQNSIDTNGTRLQGEISLRDHELRAANTHAYRIQTQQAISDLQEQLVNYDAGSSEYAQIQGSIKNLTAQLQDPMSKKFDDDYRQNYVINKSGMLDMLKRTYRNYVSGFTYDQYKDLIAERNYKQDVDQYYNTLVDDNNKTIAKNKKKQNKFEFSRVNPYAINYTATHKAATDKTVASYTSKELLDLDAKNTAKRTQELQEELGAYQKQYAENRQHLAESIKYWEVSEYFKHGVKAHQNDPLSSLGYWGYAIYPMLGSTFSSPEQLTSTVAQGVSMGGFASTPYTGPIGAAVGVGGGLVAGAFGIKSGLAENTTEAGQKRIDNFKEMLSEKKRGGVIKELKERSKHYWKQQGWSDEQIKEYLDGEDGDNRAINDYFTGLTQSLVDKEGNGYVKRNGISVYTNPIADPEVRNAELYSTQGLQALYDADNARTVAGNLFQTLVSITPTGSARKAFFTQLDRLGSRILSKEVAAETVKDAAGRVTAKTASKPFSKTMAEGYARGAKIAEMAGFGLPGEIIGGSIGALGNAAARIGIDKLPIATRNLLRSFEQGVMHKYQDVYDKLLPNSKFGKALTIYGGRAAKTTAASMMSEAAEEAVQYLNSKENFADKYGWGGMSIGDAIINDIYQGARVFNSYGALLGMSNSDLLNDAEYWSNVQGGFALGGIHTGMIRIGAEGFNAYKEIPTHAAIIETATMNRELDKKDRASNVEFARQAMRKRTEETLSVLDWMEKNDSRREDPFFTAEDYAEKRKAAQRISQMVNDKTIRTKLAAKGIVYGTEEYANAIADKYAIEDQAAKNKEERNQINTDQQKLQNSKEYQEELNSIIEQSLLNDFEETIKGQRKAIEAGNKAVAQEIERATQAGEDTETSEFKRSLQDIRQTAQQQEQSRIDAERRTNLISWSRTAHRLQSLINLRAQHNTISDFFGFLNDKFNLKVKRPDAKLITQSVDSQIQQLKEQLANVLDDFNTEMSDGAILDYIQALPIVRANSEEIERLEIADAMLQADAEVINKHLSMFEEGLIRKEDGSYEYNPAEYNARNKRYNKLNKDLAEGKITLEQYIAQQKEKHESIPYDSSAVNKNPLKRRIAAIMEARQDDKALEHMADDIENGDGVVKILEELAKEENKTNTSDEAINKAKEASESFDFEEAEQPTAVEEQVLSEASEQPVQPSEQLTAKQKYERRKQKANEKYKNRKKSLRDIRKNAYATFVPIPTPLLDLANYLITKAEIGTYKIAQFAEELKQVAKNRGFNANDFLSGIKSFYIDKAVSIEDPSLLENFSTPQEIRDFHYGDEMIIKRPVVVTGNVQAMQQQIDEETQKINTQLSSHYDTVVNYGDTVVVYPNREAFTNARFGERNVFWKGVRDGLIAANTSDEEFRDHLTKLFENFKYKNVPIDEYVKYRNVEGMIDAIANVRCNQEDEESVQNGKRIRNAVVSIMLNKEEQIDKSYFVGDYEAFRQQVLKLYNKITSKTNGRGLTVLDTDVPIYGEDYNGRKISSEADILVTDGTKIYAIDVRYSFQSIRDNWNIRYPNATFTINEHVTRRLKQIEQIINNKFKRQVNGLYCLPIIYNPSDEVFGIEYDQNGSELMEVKAEFQDPVDNVDVQKDAAEQLVDNINKNIAEYNEVAEEARKYDGVYQPIESIELQQYESEQEYADYLNSLHADYDNLTDRIHEMRTLINQKSNIYDEVWQYDVQNETEQQPVETSAKLDRLSQACAELDYAIQEISTLPITTDAERNNLQKFIDTLFEAQIALDDMLQDKDAAAIDVTDEEVLITKAIEILTENKDAFGKEAMFARRWWATQFTIGPTTNTTESVKSENEMFFGYINRIESWVDTVRNIVLPNIDNNTTLQEWYCSVLNYYFNELLNNATDFANNVLQDAAQKAVIQNSVKNGRDLIDDFNSLYDTRPDEEFTGPISSPADRINRMPTKWKDLYGWTNSIMPSFNEMGDFNGIGRFYYYLSISPTFLYSKFVLSQRKDGKLQLYIEGIGIDGRKHDVTLTFENDITKAPEKDLDRWVYVNKARQKFIRKAIAALNFVNDNSGYEIRFDKATNKGQILYNEDGTLDTVSKWLFTGSDNRHDLYTIKLSKADRVGILVRLSGDNVSPNTYNVRGGDNLMDDIGGFDRDYLKQKLHTQSGAIVYFYNTGNDQYIGVPIQSQPIGQDASKLVYLIEKYMSGDRVDQYGFDILELLKMRLYIADPERKLSRRNNTSNMITIGDGSVTIGDQTYDIVSNKTELINRIAQLPNVTRGTDLNKYLRTSNNSVISRVRTLFGQSAQDKMQLTNGLVFEKDDFVHKNAGQNVQDGSTWLGYMLRNNLLGTSAYKMGYKELRISNIRVVPKGIGEEKTLQQEIKHETSKPKVVVRGDDFFDKLAKLRKVLNAYEMDYNRSSEEQESFVQAVQEYFDSILGENGKVKFTDKDIEGFIQISKNERIAGVCSSSIIEMSKYAPFSVAWHEAFHKVFELMIPANERDSFYKAYKSSIYGKFKNPTDRDIAESFADMYMQYMENKTALNKADSLFKKFKPWWKSITLAIGMTWRIGYNNAKEMYALYRKVNQGAYKDTKITEEQNERFKKLFGDALYYKVTNTDTKVSADFSHLADIGDRDKLVRSLAYYILKSFGIDELAPNVGKVKITGGNLKDKPTLDRIAEMYGGSVEEYLKSQHPVFEEVFEKVEREYTTKDGKIIKKNFYPKFEALSRHIADYISTIFDTMRKPKIEDDDTISKQDTQEEDSEGVDFKANDTDYWDKAAYEFSKLDGLMDHVKLFFGTIPYGVYQQVENEDGTITKEVVTDYSRNKFGCPEFMPVEEVWNLIVNKFNTASSIEELDQMLEQHAGEKEVYAQVYSKFHSLVEKIYKKNEDGKIIVAQTDFDKEALALQILSAIQSQKNTFLVALSEKQDLNDQEGKSVRIVESSMDRDSKSYPDQWTQYLVSGQIGVFERERGEGNILDSEGRKKKTVLLFRQGMGGTNGNDIFSKTAKFFVDARTQITNSDAEVIIEGVKYNLNKFDDVSRIKNEIIHKLNTIGIMFERDAFDYMLSELYGGVDIESVRRFLNDSPVSDDKQVIETEKLTTLQSFIDKINRYVNNQGVLNQDLVENEGYGKIGFVNKLAKWQGRYKRISSQNMAYALNGKKLYSISQNNSISHIIKQLNTSDLNNETVKCLSGFGYNVTRDDLGMPIGSIILKAIQNREPLHMEGFTYIGFKTDNKGDQGSEYTDESTVEDYMAKLTMLQQGYLIFPTLADKSTWMLMNGVPIPGMRFIDTRDNNENSTTIVQDAPTVRIIAGKPYLIPNDRVLDQMIEYAKTEMLAIQQCMEDLGYDKIPGYEKAGRKVLSDEEKIGNYHKKNGNIEPNGTRFLSLTKVVTNEYDPKTQSYKLVEHNLNDPRESSVTLLQRAQDVFFARRDGETVEQMIERQREAMALTLAIQTQNEINTAVDLGIVQKKQYQAVFGNRTVTVSKDEKSLLNLDTKDLNASQVQALYTHIMNTTKTKAGVLWKDVADNQKRAFYSNMARSLAIAGILQDATNRHIICSQEVQRCFSGHPAFFKVKYSSTGIKDSAFDIQKRIGGMVSTGEDNITELPGINKQYTCAECADYEVGSTSNIASRLLSMFSESNARYIFGVRTQAWDDAYSLSMEELVEKYPEQKKLIEEQQKRGSDYAKAFTKGINVADGASYITADMCRDMLRMRGAYTNKVRKAFKILMSSSKYNWTQVAKSYKTVYEAINIVPTKYTAYGFRPHTLNGSQVSDVAVAYYNKFALFPIFPCMATGKMKGIYDKMLSEGVEMLLMTSAIKLGSQGSVSYDGNEISAPFNKYVQDYAYLRRQLNTDPEEGSETHIGTQMVKIGLSNLVAEREYKDLYGNPISGKEILSGMMHSINSLARIGAQEITDMFTTDGRIDFEKMSEYLKEQLTTRNANKTIIQAIQSVIDPVTGKVKLASPLAATTDASWIESIFISTMNKHIVDITTPGKSFVQRSIFAMEGNTQEGEGSIQGDEGMAPTLNRGQKLQMINEEGSMDAVISIDYFQDILPEGLSFDQAKQWLVDKGIISGYRTNAEDMSQEWHNAKATMIGYRIPTQAQSSIHALRIVDVLPATKTTIILPEEFTKITGSDFDIDHLYLASFNYNLNESSDSMTEATTVFDPTEDESKYHQNKILESLMILLKDTENSLNHLYKPIDNDTELITNVSDYIQETGSTKGEPYNFGTLHEQVIRKNDYITGKKGIGPFALNSTGHVLCRQFGVKFNPTKLVQATRLSDLDVRLDKDDNPIESWLSGFINAHVDIVKDPYISRLNVNQFTYNTLNLMIRCGWGDTALWFLANPIIRAMSQANDLADSQYMKRPSKNKSGKTYREELVYNAVKEFLNEDEISDDRLDWLLNNKNSLEARIAYINDLDKIQDKLKESAISGKVDHDVALKVFYAWKILEKYSRSLGTFVQHTKVDTRKYGKNFIAVQKYYSDYLDIFRPEDSDASMWDLESLRSFEEGSWMKTKTDLVATLPQTVFGGQTFNANPRFVNAVIKFAKELERGGQEMSMEDVVMLSRHLQTAIKSKYFVQYAHEVLNMSDKDIADLFIGYKSMNRQLVSLKYLIANNPAYARLANNPFLNQIYSMLEDRPVFANGREMSDRPGFVTVLDNVDDSKLNSDLLSEGWLDLMNDEDGRIQKFARKMVLYAFFSSGEFNGWNKLMKYVPYEWIAGEVDLGRKSYSSFIEDELRAVSDDYSDLYDSIVANNFMDYRFAEQTDGTNEDGSLNFLNADRGVKIGKGVSSDQVKELSKYVSIRRKGMRAGHQDSYELYKLIDVVKAGKNYHPIYAKIKKRGYHTRGNDIYEYGWDFNYAENENKASDTFDYESALKRVKEYLDNGQLESFSEANIRAINRVFAGREQKQKTAPKILNDVDWEFMEYSGFSGVLRELPPKVRMNGGMVTRPIYEFGRVYLTENEKEFVEEHVKVVDENGNTVDINAQQLDDMIKSISDYYDHMVDKSKSKFEEISYRDWKKLLSASDSFGQFVEHYMVTEMYDWNGFDYSDLIGEYNKQTKTIQIEEDFYNMVKKMADNIETVDKLIDAVKDKWAAIGILIRYRNMYDAFEDYNSETSSNLRLQYSYSDKRQQELFSDEDFDPQYMNHCKS